MGTIELFRITKKLEILLGVSNIGKLKYFRIKFYEK